MSIRASAGLYEWTFVLKAQVCSEPTRYLGSMPADDDRHGYRSNTRIPTSVFRQWTSLGRTVAVDSQTLVISDEGYTVSREPRLRSVAYCSFIAPWKLEATDKRIRRRKVAAELYASQENEQEH